MTDAVSTNATANEGGYVGAEGNYGRPDLNTLVGGMEDRIVTDGGAPVEEVKVDSTDLENPADGKPEEKDFSDQVKWEREKFEEKKRLQAEKESLRKEREELSATEQPKDGKPNLDDYDAIIDKIINGEDETIEAKEDQKALTQEDVDRLVQEKLDAKLQERDREVEETQTIDNFKKTINESISAKSDEYRHINAMGEMDLVYNVIEQDYTNNVEKYGQEWADKNLMDTDAAAQKVEKHLASEMKRVLSSEHMKPVLQEILGLQGQSSSTVQSNTITNDFNNASATQVDDASLTDEERFSLALSKVN